MGINVDFYLKGKWTDKQKSDFESAAKERGLWDEHTRFLDYTGGYTYLSALDRYYGPGYERGHWPHIRAIFMLLRHHFPDAVLLYGGDSEIEYCEEVTDEFIAKMDSYWLSENGDNYHKRIRAATKGMK